MIAALTKLKAPALLERFLREVVTSSYDGSENAALLASINVLGDAQAAAILSTLVSARMPERPNECTELLLALSENPSLCFPEVAEAAVAGLDLHRDARLNERKPSIGNPKSRSARSTRNSSKTCSARYSLSRVGLCAAPPLRRSPRAPKSSVP